MTTAAEVKARQLRTEDQRVFLRGLSWEDFETILRIRGDQAGVRITYLEGTLELMSPSSDHEAIKTMIARLLEIWALERDVPLNGYGSWTLKKEVQERGLEPDECYLLDATAKEKGRPDLAIEVIWTHGGIDKLEVYRGLDVPEVWLWDEDAIRVFRLVDGAYAERPASILLPTLDLSQLLSFARRDDQTAAVREYRDLIRPA